MRSKLLLILGALFVVNTGYIAAFASPTIFYMGNVVLHLVVGLGLTLTVVAMFQRWPSLAVGLAGAALAGVVLAVIGNTQPHRWLLGLHIMFGLVALGASMWFKWMRLALVVALALQVFRFTGKPPQIKNPTVVPTSMAEEGAGPQSPFWPSSSNTNTGKIIPANFFMDSKICAECHKDIYDQWNSSAHHFASFNNQFYRKSIEYMQSVAGTKPTKWCAACHDHAVFFNGRFDKPIKDQIDTPEAQNGLGCLSCHAIVNVDGTMGNAGFVIEYPPLHDLASSHNPWMRKLDSFLTYLNPKPHKATMLKSFMREQSAEFCSTCHKVHLDVPVNEYRWVRGFNDYDNWQASGISGQGARSFYYPPKSQNCVDCHMPMIKSADNGSHEGSVHSHRFPAANTALPTVNQDHGQLAETEKFLKSGFITVDIFAVSPVEETKGQPQMKRRNQEAPQLSSTFAVGEEAEQSGAVFLREVGKLSAPIDTAKSQFAPGSTVRVDTVVRTRKIGHFFPGGTVDSFDVWLELQAKDATGKIVYWSGKVDDGGRGPVERGAHFYRSYQIDAEGNMINKRNAFQARSVLYVRLIPPGAADVAHFRMKIPSDAKGPITIQAKLNYRKFMHYYTQFSYAGEPKGNDSKLVSTSFENREFSFDKSNIPANVSGKIKGEIPNLPIVTLATAITQFGLGDSTWQPVVQKKDRERWNDWGIGMLLQGDLKGAEYAFKKVTEAEPEYADGWLNVARALIQEGETEAAKPYLEKALALNNKLGRIHFFKAMTQKADGDYDGAVASLKTASAMYPRDRVVWNQIGRVYFLQRKYKESVDALSQALDVDPEDLQAHYTLMLAYRGLGDTEKAAREEKLFRRFKADESAQSITAKPRMLSAEDNNERQMIHDHESAQ